MHYYRTEEVSGMNLKQIRERHYMTQLEVAEKCGISFHTYQRYEYRPELLKRAGLNYSHL